MEGGRTSFCASLVHPLLALYRGLLRGKRSENVELVAHLLFLELVLWVAEVRASARELLGCDRVVHGGSARTRPLSVSRTREEALCRVAERHTKSVVLFIRVFLVFASTFSPRKGLRAVEE